MKSKSCNKQGELITPHSLDESTRFYRDVLIRIRRQPVRPAESGCEALFSVTECSRDEREISHRLDCEGMSFLTKTLPSLGKALDRALLGDSNAFVSTPFKKARDSKLPMLFGDLLRRVFDADGSTRSDADAQSVRLLRQLTLGFYKLNVPYAPELNEKVLKEFSQVDKSLPSVFIDGHGGYTESTIERLSTLPHQRPVELDDSLALCAQVARFIVATTLGSLDPRNIRPRHGPGAVSTGERGPSKVHFTTIIERLDRVYPFMEYMKYNLTHVLDTWKNPLRSVSTGTAKVVLVPKDSRGPRLISCEPLSNQWIQQGQMTIMVDRLESHPLTKGQVNFADQSVNGKLALDASLTGCNATLDMKDASDRVSWALVELLFPEHWREALFASRSPATKLPNGDVMALNKFAPMGSAVCFPVEALVFFALAVGAVYCKQKRIQEGSLSHSFGAKTFLDKRRIRKIARTIFVYGDDIICRTEDCGSIRAYLENFALRFNSSKCCETGLFRESCGVDAFAGVNVTPVRFRTLMVPSSITPEAYLSWVEYSNSLFDRGLWHAAEYIKDVILASRPTPTLYTPDRSEPSRKGGVFFYRPFPGSPSCNRRRWNPDIQCREALVWTVVAAKASTTYLGWGELLRVETLGSPQASALTGGGKRAGVYAIPRRYKLKRGWVSIGASQ